MRRARGNGVWTRAAKHELMVVIAQGVLIGEGFHVGQIAVRHIVKAHRGSTLEGGVLAKLAGGGVSNVPQPTVTATQA